MRLIDADELIKNFNDSPISLAMKKLIDTQPTAYDIDNIVEELEKLQTEAFGYAFKYDEDFYEGQANGLGKAIDIVKQGVR